MWRYRGATLLSILEKGSTVEKFDPMIAISTFGSVSLAVMGVVIDYTIL